MTINAVAGRQADKNDVIATQAKSISISSNPFGEVLSFLGTNDLTTAEKVCHHWNECIRSTKQWERQFHNRFGISTKIDSKKSYKENVLMVSPSLLDGSIWLRYIGYVGPMPKIPEAISLNKWHKPDPCDPNKTIGREYVWIYYPEYIETQLENFTLSGPDDSHNPEAPKLVQEDGSAVRRIPVTLNNVIELFKLPKTGYPSIHDTIGDEIIEQHGNKRIPAGWVCMRKNVIGKNLTFADQQMLAAANGVEIAQLLHRVVFNFLEHTRSNAYPDGGNTFARTETLTHEFQDWPSGCGAGGPSGLDIGNRYTLAIATVGVGVTLSTKV